MQEAARLARAEVYLTDALVELGKQKNLYKVQVKELCAAAQVNRTTFYRRHENIPGFIEDAVETFIRRMDAYLEGENLFVQMLNGSAVQTYSKCVQFMCDNAEFVRIMSGPNGTPLLRKRLVSLWDADLRKAVASEIPSLHERVDVDILSRCVTSMMWGLLEYTVNDNVKYTPEYLAGQFSHLLWDCIIRSYLE